jgi:DMSO/TMAO reductase YedYZ molybdopterin-dependent catalytic subunit
MILVGMLALGVVASIWVMGAESSEGQQGGVHNCPPAGKWAISTWSGDDDTDAGEALASCGAGAIAAAYYLDPESQAWQRWFADRPDVSTLEALKGMQGILTLGTVVGAGAIPTPTASTFGDSELTLILDGFVESPLNLTFDDLLAMPRSTVYAELYCVGGPTTILEKGSWTGVRLGLMLEEAGVLPEAVKVAFYADDGFATDLTVVTAMRQDIILAYERDGEPLPETLRLVVPGKWGYKWIRGVTHIELVDYDFKGHYETMGYPDEADISSGAQ